MSAADPGPLSSSAGDELAAGIADIHVSEPAGTPGVGEPAAVAVLSKDQFHEAFVMLHQFAAGSGEMITGNKGWAFIAVQEREKGAAREASDALYRLAELYPAALGFLLRPGSEAMVCVLALGSYGVGKVVGVRRAIAHYGPQTAVQGAPATEQRPLGQPQEPSNG